MMCHLCPVLAAIILIAGVARSQSPQPRRQAGSATISIAAGTMVPLSRSALTDFWSSGPAVSFFAHVHQSRSTGFGLAIDAARLTFDGASFSRTYPGVAVQEREVYFWTIALSVRHSLAPGRRFSPFLAASLGAGRITSATYRTTVGGIRRVYYDVAGTMRAVAGFAGGADLYLNRSFAFTAEARAILVHNDPSAGAFAGLRGGFLMRF